MKILVVGTGITGATIANLCAKENLDVIVIERENYIGGLCADKFDDRSECFKQLFGPHIFHTNNEKIMEFLNNFSCFDRFTHSVKALVDDNFIDYPVNVNTIESIYKTKISHNNQALELINKDKNALKINNFEDVAINQVGKRIYEKMIKNYTIKQWQENPKNISKELCKRIPIRLTRENDFFNEKFCGIPINGFSEMIKKMLIHKNIKVFLNTDFTNLDDDFIKSFDYIFFTGEINENIQFRSTKFRFIRRKKNINFSVINLPQKKYITRITDFNLLCGDLSNKEHLLCIEMPVKNNKYNKLYPLQTLESIDIYNNYKQAFLNKYKNVILCGRLAEYKYLNIDAAILNAFEKFEFFKQNIKK